MSIIMSKLSLSESSLPDHQTDCF